MFFAYSIGGRSIVKPAIDAEKMLGLLESMMLLNNRIVDLLNPTAVAAALSDLKKDDEANQQTSAAEDSRRPYVEAGEIIGKENAQKIFDSTLMLIHKADYELMRVRIQQLMSEISTGAATSRSESQGG